MTDIVMVHGAGGTPQELAPLARALGPDTKALGLILLGHCGRPSPEVYGVPEVAADLIDQMDYNKIDRAFVFGYSFGGLCALHMAYAYPERVIGVCALATKYVFDPETIRHILHILDPERQKRLGINAAPWVEAIHSKHRELLQAVTGTERTVTEERLSSLTRPVLVINGRQDQLVPRAESERMSSLIPRGRLALFDGVAHPIDAVPLVQVAGHVRSFMDDVRADLL